MQDAMDNVIVGFLEFLLEIGIILSLDENSIKAYHEILWRAKPD